MSNSEQKPEVPQIQEINVTRTSYQESTNTIYFKEKLNKESLYCSVDFKPNV